MKLLAFVLTVVAGALLLIEQSQATPEKRSWHREKLLGANEKEFYYLRTERDNPGSYYEYTDRFKICRAPRENPAVVEEILIREVHYIDTSALGHWVAEEKNHRDFDLTSYLLENHVVMPLPTLRPPSLDIDTAGVFLHDANVRALVLSRNEFLSQMPEIAEQERLSATTGMQRVTEVEVVDIQSWSTPACYYCTVYSEMITSADRWYESLLIIPAARVKAAAEIIGRARGPH